MLMTGNRRPKWFFYPLWVVLSAISIPIAWVIAWALILQIEKAVGGTIQVGGQTRITEDFLFSCVFYPAFGLVAGCLQYLLLRRCLPRMGWWIVATVVGWLLPIAVLRLVSATLPVALDVSSVWSVAVVVVLIGGCIGLAQWLVLRQRVRHAARWILASVLGWGMAGLVRGDMIWNLLLPATAASIALWLLLDKLRQREGSGPNPPPNPSLEAAAPIDAD
jgi:hypothetical protein